MRVGETVTDQDLARALRNEQGTFICQRGGQSQLVTAERNHSITSCRAVGVTEPVITAPGSNPGYSITKLSNQILVGDEQDWQQNRSDTVGQGSRS